MSHIDGPDFICIGMPKAGTGWLYDQLDAHPDFWMPPVKELLYLNHDITRIPLEGRRGGGALARLKHDAGEREQRRSRPPRDRDRDLAFEQAARACNCQPRTLADYASLFRFKDDKLSGDISPVYTNLRADIIEQVARKLPQTKLLLMARDPVARAWSRMSMQQRGAKFDSQLLERPADLRTYLETSNRIQGKSFPTEIVRHWRKHAANLELRTFLLDDIASDPDQARRAIWQWLGADPNTPVELAANHDKKSRAEKLAMTDVAKAVLVEFFADEIRACAELLGGAAKAWPAKYGL